LAAGSVAGSVRWAFLTGAMARLLPPAFAIVLARLLSPEDFGLLAVAMVVVAFVSLFQDLGLKQALVQRREAGSALKAAVFWGGIGLGGLWFLALWVAAPWLGEFYRSPGVVPVIRSLGALFLIAPLGAVPEALLLREMAFRRLFRVELLPSLAPGVVSITLAFMGWGVWSLVWGTLAGSALRVVGLWTQVDWRPSARPNAAQWRGLFRFGGWVSLEALLGWTITYADQGFAGRFMGAAQVGFYRMGFSLSLLPATGISQVLGQVTFPAFSRVQDDLPRVKEGFEKAVRTVALVTVPLGAGLAAFADPVLPMLLGPNWGPTVGVVQLLAAVGVLSSLVNVAPPLYRAIGRVDIMPKFFLARAAVSVPAYWYAAQHGLLVLTATHLGLTSVFAPINLGVASRVFGSSARSLAGAVGGPVACAAGAFAVARAVSLGIPAGLEPYGVAGAMAAFVLAYGALVRLALRARYQEFAGLFRSVMGTAPQRP